MTAPASGTSRGQVGPSTLVPLEVPGPHRSAVERLVEVAERSPDRLALVAADGDLTYGQLHQRVVALAAELLTVLPNSSGTAQPVGILAEQGSASVAAMFAVMAAGSPAVVLDLQLPQPRLAQIVERAGIGVVLADEERAVVAAGLPGVETVLGLLPVGAGSPAAALPAIGLDDPATLVFTSGTTGLPKGVVWTHRTFLACGFTSKETLRLLPEDRISLVLPQGFAVGQLAVAGALLNGATLCVRDPRVHGTADLVGWLERTEVSVLNCTPSLLRAVQGALTEDQVLSSVRLVTTAGEKVYGSDVVRARRHLSAEASFMNWMGSSETEALASFEITSTDPVPDGAVPTGTAVPLRDLEILGPDDLPVPHGEVGVLHATSAHFSIGYWGDPVTTASRFRVLADGRTRYCTGDRARMSAEGVVEVLGRGDDAVKVRGYLVEPAEVETAMRRLPSVADVVVRGAGADDEVRLVAWVVLAAGEAPTAAELRRAVHEALPEWMVPREVVFLSELPRNERGKVDVRALPAPPLRREVTEPQTRTEALMEEVWSGILNLEHVGREESFTALGGESLAMEEMLAAVEQELGVSLTAADLAAHPTLAEFAAVVDEEQQGRASRPGDNVAPAAAAARVLSKIVGRFRSARGQ